MSQSLLARYNHQAGGRCKRCGGEMAVGQALEPIMSGTPDFAGDGYTWEEGTSGKWRRV